MREIELFASTARTESAGTNGTAFPLFQNEQLVMALLEFTDKKTDTGDLCDVYLDISPDGGTTWLNAAHFTQALGDGTDAASEAAVFYPSASGTSAITVTGNANSGAVRPYLVGNQIRGRYIIVASGTDNESFTFKLRAFVRRI